METGPLLLRSLHTLSACRNLSFSTPTTVGKHISSETKQYCLEVCINKQKKNFLIMQPCCTTAYDVSISTYLLHRCLFLLSSALYININTFFSRTLYISVYSIYPAWPQHSSSPVLITVIWLTFHTSISLPQQIIFKFSSKQIPYIHFHAHEQILPYRMAGTWNPFFYKNLSCIQVLSYFVLRFPLPHQNIHFSFLIAFWYLFQYFLRYPLP